MKRYPITRLMGVLHPRTKRVMKTSQAKLLAEFDPIEAGNLAFSFADKYNDGVLVRVHVQHSEYDKDLDLSGSPGDIVFFAEVTDNHGDWIEWGELDFIKTKMEERLIPLANKYNYSYKTIVSADHYCEL
jgi:hypothetical protein